MKTIPEAMDKDSVAQASCAKSNCYPALGRAVTRCAKKGVTLFFPPLETKEAGARWQSGLPRSRFGGALR